MGAFIETKGISVPQQDWTQTDFLPPIPEIFYELHHARCVRGLAGVVALQRLEQVAPFPAMSVAVVAAQHPNAEIVWVQDFRLVGTVAEFLGLLVLRSSFLGPLVMMSRDFKLVFIEDTEVCLLCFDMSDVSTFDRTQFWMKRDHNPKCLFILVGTKEDLLTQEQSGSMEPISHWAEEAGIPFFPTSALKGGEHIRIRQPPDEALQFLEWAESMCSSPHVQDWLVSFLRELCRRVHSETQILLQLKLKYESQTKEGTNGIKLASSIGQPKVYSLVLSREWGNGSL
ncbi:hypothetical protein AK812_SmicGene13490 [Symbiodinium microadriaticum]|uniref:2-oxoglutarate dehydrogenase E1 component/KDG C-terminal domain-containing protein n=1 Tax=Symbiodinium microadriaticum TaxID=2951 RepID=A0A1Q9E816_SYMMI|nr:hypothetical protein AK812_SmicGene13490 [Symbiodinium microadriaticum]